jgi:energy-converting hydrogenase Eha subunit A
MIQIDATIIIIIALVAIIIGMIVGMMLTRPRYPSYRARRSTWDE